MLGNLRSLITSLNFFLVMTLHISISIMTLTVQVPSRKPFFPVDLAIATGVLVAVLSAAVVGIVTCFLLYCSRTKSTMETCKINLLRFKKRRTKAIRRKE